MLEDCLQLIGQGKYQAAIECLQPYTEGTEAAEAAFNIANCYIRLNDFAKAIEWFDKAIAAAGGKYPDASCNKGACFEILENHVSALSAFDEAIAATGGQYPIASCNKGLCLERLGRHELAISAYEEAIAAAGGQYPLASYNKGNCYVKLGKYRLALSAYDESITAAGGNYPKASFGKGVCFNKLGDCKSALFAYEEAIVAAEGNYPEASCNKGVCFKELGDHRSALSAYDEAIAAAGGNYPEAFCNKGVSFGELGDHRSALSAYDEAIAAAGGSYPAASYNKGVCLDKLGDHRSALSAYEEAIAAAGGNYPMASCNKGVCLDKLGDHRSALTAYEEAIVSAGGNYPDAFCNKGVSLAALGDYVSALYAYDEALAATGGSYPRASYNKGNSFDKLGDYRSALSAYEEAIVTAGGSYPKASCNKGVCLQNLGDHEAALIDCKKAIADSLNDHYPLAWITMATIQLELGNRESARESAFTAIGQDSVLRRAFDFIHQHFTAHIAYANRIKLLDIVFMRQLQKINFGNSKDLIQALRNFEDETPASLYISLLLYPSDMLGTGMGYVERLRQAYLIAAANRELVWVFYIIDYLLDVQDGYTLDGLDYYFYLTAGQQVAAPLSELERIATDAGYHNIAFTAIDEYLYELSTPLPITGLDDYLKNETEKLLYHQHWLTKQPYTVNITRNELELQYLSVVVGTNPSDNFNITAPAFIILQDCLRKEPVDVNVVGCSLENLLRSAKQEEALQAIRLLAEAEAADKLTAKDASLLKAFTLLKYEKVQEHNRQEARKGNVDLLATSIGSTAVGHVIGLFVPGIFLYSFAISLISTVTAQLLRNPIPHAPDFSWNDFLALLKKDEKVMDGLNGVDTG